MQDHRTTHDFPRSDGRIDLSKIDVRRLSPEQWVDLKTQIASRAHSDRNQAIVRATIGAIGWFWRAFRRVQNGQWLRAAWISHVRKCRERIAAAQLRGLSDRSLRDMGLTRGEIERRVRYCAPAVADTLNHCGVEPTKGLRR
jgi:uncharacterized protein YjiS (DUF1127 family)